MSEETICQEKELICIQCPLGCMLTASLDAAGGVKQVTGNTCRRGEDYARKELLNPTRTVTSTVLVRDGALKRVPVKTASDIPKDKLFTCMQEIKQIQVTAPVKLGDIIRSDIAGTKVALIATRSVDS